MTLIPPSLYAGHRRSVPRSQQPLTEEEQERVAADVAAALRQPSHHKIQSDPWRDVAETRAVLEEDICRLRQELVVKERMLAAVTAADVDRFNPDDRESDREDGRLREVAQDEAARRERIL